MGQGALSKIKPCCPLPLPSVFPSIRVFSNESALCLRWPKYWMAGYSPWGHTEPDTIETLSTQARLPGFAILALPSKSCVVFAH